MPVRRSPLRSVALAADRTAWDGAGCNGYPNFAPPSCTSRRRVRAPSRMRGARTRGRARTGVAARRRSPSGCTMPNHNSWKRVSASLIGAPPLRAGARPRWRARPARFRAGPANPSQLRAVGPVERICRAIPVGLADRNGVTNRGGRRGAAVERRRHRAVHVGATSPRASAPDRHHPHPHPRTAGHNTTNPTCSRRGSTTRQSSVICGGSGSNSASMRARRSCMWRLSCSNWSR